MFCPKCATQNLEGASFCRTCGANISLVPQALTGQLVQPPVEEVVDDSCGRRGRRRQLTLDVAFKNMFLGVAFVIIAIVLSRTIGAGWWFWMLIPAFSLMGTGIAQYIRIKDRETRVPLGAARVQPVMPRRTEDAFPRRTDELRPPVPSVTEGTTRHLGVEPPTRHLETHERK
ncbi:MAG TPA: zinc-ribbon domain-containing protein [Pyrinomonadaceae bacterium]